MLNVTYFQDPKTTKFQSEEEIELLVLWLAQTESIHTSINDGDSSETYAY